MHDLKFFSRFKLGCDNAFLTLKLLSVDLAHK